MDATIVDGDVPYPPNSGKRLRSLNLVLPLARRHRITYIARCSSKEEGDIAATFLRDQNIEPIMVEAPLPAKTGPAFYGRLAANIVSSAPYSVQSHHSNAMRSAVAAHAAGRSVDLWQVEWFGYLYCVAGIAGPVVLQAHNIESVIWQRYAETEPSSLKRAYVREQWRKMLAFERRSFASVSRIVAVSEQDAGVGRRLYGEVPFGCIDNGVDLAFYSAGRADPNSRQILFLGALDWRPNQDAIELLLSEIFPAVRLRVPDATLAIVGRSPSPVLAERARATEGVSRTGRATIPVAKRDDGRPAEDRGRLEVEDHRGAGRAFTCGIDGCRSGRSAVGPWARLRPCRKPSRHGRCDRGATR